MNGANPKSPVDSHNPVPVISYAVLSAGQTPVTAPFYTNVAVAPNAGTPPYETNASVVNSAAAPYYTIPYLTAGRGDLIVLWIFGTKPTFIASQHTQYWSLLVEDPNPTLVPAWNTGGGPYIYIGQVINPAQTDNIVLQFNGTPYFPSGAALRQFTGGATDIVWIGTGTPGFNHDPIGGALPTQFPLLTPPITPGGYLYLGWYLWTSPGSGSPPPGFLLTPPTTNFKIHGSITTPTAPLMTLTTTTPRTAIARLVGAYTVDQLVDQGVQIPIIQIKTGRQWIIDQISLEILPRTNIISASANILLNGRGLYLNLDANGGRVTAPPYLRVMAGDDFRITGNGIPEGYSLVANILYNEYSIMDIPLFRDIV